MKPLESQENKEKLLYELYGVSNHYGSLQTGHYTANCKNAYLQEWFEFDDNKVK